jgi:hypothetical protein
MSQFASTTTTPTTQLEQSIQQQQQQQQQQSSPTMQRIFGEVIVRSNTNSSNKAPLKEKFVAIYEALFQVSILSMSSRLQSTFGKKKKRMQRNLRSHFSVANN